MEWNCFDRNRHIQDNEYNGIEWREDSGLAPGELKAGSERLEKNLSPMPKSVVRALLFEYILKNARLAVDRADPFKDKINHGGIIGEFRQRNFSKVCVEGSDAADTAFKTGAYHANEDFGHVCPGFDEILSLGYSGILKKIRFERDLKGPLTEGQKAFYDSCEITYGAIIGYLERFAEIVGQSDADSSACLKNLSQRRPGNLYEAMQSIYTYHYLYEFVNAGRARTLGGLDRLLYPFYKADIENGTFTKPQVRELLKYFLNKFSAAHIPYNQPFMLGGVDADGVEQTNELSYLIVEAYNELSVESPKIHIRVSDSTPERFIKLVLKCIKGGNSSFCFANDKINIENLMRVGVSERDARNYVYIGCYEPAATCEIPCTGNANVNLAKAVEFVLFDGCDLATGIKVGPCCGRIGSFAEFKEEIKKQIAFMTERCMKYVSAAERHYMEINPDPLLSATLPSCLESGRDAYEGGAKYNNSSVTFACIASLVDSLCAVKALIYDQKLVTLNQLREILRSDWNGYDGMRQVVLRLKEKYGNGDEVADGLMLEFSSFCASAVNNKPNGRGGVFKAGLFSIDFCHEYGKKTCATPDGRKKGMPLSKNLCSVTGMDRNGITTLIRSVTKMDLAAFPNGSVLDFILHPTAVSGEEGTMAMYALIRTFFDRGGATIHGNVINSEALKAAQQEPEKYKNLQVRICGWNVYFVNLSKPEQDEFIRQAEHIA